MKNIIFTIGLFLSMNAFAIDEMSSLEKELYSAGLVDKDLRYTDLKLVGSYFKSESEKITVSLPTKIDNTTEISSILFTPYYIGYTFRFDAVLSPEQFHSLGKELTSTETQNELCETMYNERFYKINNVAIELNYVDKNRRTIANIELNSKKCNF
ncbi:hypothetical protein DX910_00455 [Acinetobacter haemolyticus]|nr:hypothetical protein DX910_00455 [Acinetobacter haemolyticus]